MKKVLQQSSHSLDRLLQHSRYLEYLTRRLLTYLPGEFSKKISVLGFASKQRSKRQIVKQDSNKQQSLIIAAISPAWASKLRFYTPTLKRSLCADAQFSQLHKIIIRVGANNHSPKFQYGTKPVYSSQSASIIQNSAEHIDNLELKEALIRLAHNVNKHEGK